MSPFEELLLEERLLCESIEREHMRAITNRVLAFEKYILNVSGRFAFSVRMNFITYKPLFLCR